MTELEDGRLLALAATGDDNAVAELYRRHAAAARRAARSVTRNGPDAEDAASDAFLRVLAALADKRLDAGLRFRAYVTTAARNAAVDLVRESARCGPTSQVGDLDRAADDPMPGDRLISELEAELVVRALGNLPQRWRLVLVMVDVDGLSLRQAGEILGLSTNGTAQLAVRARSGLRRHFVRAYRGRF